MPQKLASKNHPSSAKKTLQFHQVENHGSQQSKSSSTNPRVLILSTPIKLKDGSINMKQRTIPLRIDNSKLTITTTENKNKIVSLKRSIEPPPLALPVNQLNKISPTFVKNEVGQVMGKLIPLGKFSNITNKTVSPIVSASTSALSATGSKNVECNIAKARPNKIFKLDNEEQRIKFSSVSEAKGNNAATTVSSTMIPKAENPDDQLVTFTDVKPKKRVHLVLKGYENIASVGQTGTKIKLIPLDHLKVDRKSNLLKTKSSGSIISQPKIVDVRSCMEDEIRELEAGSFSGNNMDCNYGKEDIIIDNILEKDPLDIGEMLNFKNEILRQSLERNSINGNANLGEKLTATKISTNNKPNKVRTVSESGRINSSKILTVAKGGMSIQLKFDRKLVPHGFPPNTMEKNSVIESKPSKKENVKNLEHVICNSEEKVGEEVEIDKNQADYNELCEHFSINKNNVTPSETAMLSYILYLKKKLHQSQKSRVQALTALRPKEYLGNNNLSSTQKRFVESQLRNPGRLDKKQRFMKADIVMAKDILKATGPRGYSNLRKLFSLPDISAVFKRISKT